MGTGLSSRSTADHWLRPVDPGRVKHSAQDRCVGSVGICATAATFDWRQIVALKRPGVDPKDKSITDDWIAEYYADGRVVSLQNDVWIVRVLPGHSYVWEDGSTKLGHGGTNLRLFEELARASKQAPGNLSALENPREFHGLSVRIETSPIPPTRNPETLRLMQQRLLLAYETPNKVDFFAIKLRAKGESPVKFAMRLLGNARDEQFDLTPWDSDFQAMSRLLGAMGGRPPTNEEWDLAQSWFNLGRGRCRLVEEPTGKKLIADAWPHGLEMSAVINPTRTLDAPNSAWMNDAFLHSSGVAAVSFRGVVKRPESSEAMLQNAQRRATEQDMERQKSADTVLSDSDLQKAELAAEVEGYLKANRSGLLADVSIVFARHAFEGDELFQDMLRQNYGIATAVLVHQQMTGLSEMTFCAPPSTWKNQADPAIHVA